MARTEDVQKVYIEKQYLMIKMLRTKPQEVNSEGWLVDSMANDKTKQILISGGIKPIFKGKLQGRVSWDYSSGVARFTKEILQGNIPENMPSGTLISISRSLQNQISKELSLSWIKLLNKQP